MAALDSAKFKRLTGRAVGCGCMSVFLCGFGGFLFITRMFREDSTKLPSDLELARDLGLPLELADIQGVKPPDGENAAPIYLLALKEFHKLPTKQLKLLWLPFNPSAKERAARSRALNSFQPTLRLLERATRLPHCYFGDLPLAAKPRKFAGRPMLQHELELSQMAMYLNASARDGIMHRDFDGAVKDFQILKKMGNHCPEFSVTMGAAWPVYADLSMIAGLWRFTQRYAKDQTKLGRIEQLISDIKLPNLYKSIQANFVLGRTTIREMKSLQEVGLDQTTPEVFTKAVDALYQSPGVKQAFDERLVKSYIKTFRALPKDNEDWLEIHKVLYKLNKETIEDHSIDNAINRALGIGDPNAPLMYGWIQTELHVLAEAIAVLQFRKLAGHYPEMLPLSGATSMDPFWGKTLRYAPSLYGFEISSKGKDFGKDGPYFMKRPILFRFDERRELPPNRMTY